MGGGTVGGGDDGRRVVCVGGDGGDGGDGGGDGGDGGDGDGGDGGDSGDGDGGWWLVDGRRSKNAGE